MNQNNRVLKVVLAAATLVFAVSCEKKIKLDTDQQKGSYAIGQQIGTNLKNQNIEFDPDVVAASIKDVVSGKESRMKPEEMQAALMKLQESIMKKQEEVATKNATEGKAFLEKNKADSGIKTTASGLQYKIEKEGTGKSPTEKDVVKAHYKGTTIDGKQFDSSYDRGAPAEFPLNGVIKGWTEGLQLMKVGSKAKFFIPPELGYGASARPGIPSNSVLVFEVELIDVMPPAAATKKK